MDKRLQIVDRLYATGGDARQAHPIDPEEPDELRGEYQAMSQAKFWMDHRRAERPDAATVDAIVSAAAKAAAGELPKGVREDRGPLRLFRSTPFRATVAAVVAIVAVSIGLWRNGDAPSTAPFARQDLNTELGKNADAPMRAGRDDALPEQEEVAALELDALASGRMRASGVDSALLDDRMNEPVATLATVATPSPTEVPEWGHPEELVLIKQRIEQLKARQADMGWDKPLMPLEMMPSSARDAGVRQAGASEQ